ncbi:unnamed protein product [Mytilus edulis]|uniref:Uncharacterized protein n=1 Tax=Mytilus edulis TaxID=6550 RepID=A0A8S3VK66_MYTED|nr:unnamed protein product [Mytilus edulis]
MDRMYVPNPQKWVKYYENMAKGNHNPYINQSWDGKRKQVGGSLFGSQGTFMIPIENVDHLENQNSSNPLTVQLVSPAQQTVEQAKPNSRFERRHFNLNQIGVFVDNIPVSGNLMRLNFDTSSGRTIVPAFNSMFEVTDKWACDSGNQLNRNDFAGGRDMLQIQTLGRQIFPGRTKFFMDAYQKSISKSYGYLVVDITPHSDKSYQLRTDILPDQDTIIYQPENE